MTTNTTHTPGPWHIGMKPGPIVYGPKGEQVATIETTLLDSDESLSNTRLIAASPVLLEALQAVSRLDYLHEHNALAKRVREAITLATGKEQAP